MSLKQFLVVGQSFVGLRNEKSPYELRKENMLPRFGNNPRVTGAGTYGSRPVQADWLEEKTLTEAPSVPAEDARPARAIQPVASAVPPREKRGILWYLTFGFWRKKTTQPLVQPELGLERVQVIRNDLSDSDLEVVVIKKKKGKLKNGESMPPGGSLVRRKDSNERWSALAGRLWVAGQEDR